jgi:hypothetical protein
MTRHGKKPTADDHEVGYGKPPAHTRFRKGQSGNPGGRPRGITAGRANALALKEAYRSVLVREGDRVMRLPAIQARAASRYRTCGQREWSLPAHHPRSGAGDRKREHGASCGQGKCSGHEPRHSGDRPKHCICARTRATRTGTQRGSCRTWLASSTIGSRFGSIVFRQHPADNVFVDIDAESVRNLLCDAGTANRGVELDNRVDEFLRRSLRAGAPMTSRREKPPIFGGLRPPCSAPARPEHRPAAASQRSLQACIASLPL